MPACRRSRLFLIFLLANLVKDNHKDSVLPTGVGPPVEGLPLLPVGVHRFDELPYRRVGAQVSHQETTTLGNFSAARTPLASKRLERRIQGASSGRYRLRIRASSSSILARSR